MTLIRVNPSFPIRNLVMSTLYPVAAPMIKKSVFNQRSSRNLWTN
jgi:hypothetical protein